MDINRRNFVKIFGTSAGFFSPLYNFAKRKLSNTDLSILDLYGGNTRKSFKATGFFRTQHDGTRWWLVTPDGNAFITFGVNHYHTDWWNQDYNRRYWLRRFGGHKPRDEVWNKGFQKVALNDLRRLGLNSLGMHTDVQQFYNASGMGTFPYIAPFKPLSLCHYLQPDDEKYVDIFSVEYDEICKETAQKHVAPFVRDPMILGFCMADCPPMTDKEADLYKTTTWPRRLRNLDEQSPGKRAYVNCIKERYSSVSDFNEVYRTKFKSWKALLEAIQWREAQKPINERERADNHAFLQLCIDRYYSVAKQAIQRHDPDHLFLGDKLNGNTDGAISMIKTTSKHTDIVNVQYYAIMEDHNLSMDDWSSKMTLNRPILNGDSAFTSPTESMPNPYGPHAKDQYERAQWTGKYMKNSLRRNDFVGWHMCGILDTSKKMPGKQKNQHQGLMSTQGKFYPEMEKAIIDISKNLYSWAEMAK